MVLAATTIKKELLAQLAAHHIDLVSSIIEAEVLQNAAIRKTLSAKVNETLKSFGVEAAAKTK